MVLMVSLVGQMVSGPEFVKFPPNANKKKKVIKKVSFQNDRLNRLCVFHSVHTKINPTEDNKGFKSVSQKQRR